MNERMFIPVSVYPVEDNPIYRAFMASRSEPSDPAMEFYVKPGGWLTCAELRMRMKATSILQHLERSDDLPIRLRSLPAHDAVYQRKDNIRQEHLPATRPW